jgi:predicted MFS family arabinose efflux permease
MFSFLPRGIKAYFKHYAGLPTICWNGIVIQGLTSIVAGFIFFISIYFTTVLKLNVGVAGTIISCYGVGNVLGGVIGGRLCDRYSPNIVSLGCALIQSICFFVLTQIVAIHILMLLLLIMGICNYGFITSMSVWVLNLCKREESLRLKAINIMAMASNFGIGLSALLIAFMYESGFHLIFSLASLLLITVVVYLLGLYFQQWRGVKNDVLSNMSIHSYQDDRSKIIEASNNQTKPNYKIIYLILSCVFAVGLIIAQRRTTYPIYLHTLFPNTGIKAVSILLALNPAIIVLFQTPLVGMFSRVNKIMLVGAGAFLMGFGMLMLNFAMIYSIAILACVVYTIGEMLFFSSAQLVCYESGAPKKKGHSLGIYKTVYAVSTVIGPTVGGFIYHYFGGYIVWYGCGLIGLLCLTACYWHKKETYHVRHILV